jgi:hypothetical protein
MFAIGTKIVCIDDVFPAWAKVMYRQLPKKGNIYTLRHFDVGCADIKEITENADKSVLLKGKRDYTVWVNELVNPIHPNSGKEMGFKASRFAPIENISLEQVERLQDAISSPATPYRELVPA